MKEDMIFNLSRFISRLVIIFSIAVPSALADDLTEIFEIAVENDPQIRQARAEYDAVHTLVDQGRSQILPSVEITASTSRDTQGPEEMVDSGFFVQEPHSFANGFNSQRYSLNIRQNLINFQAWYAFQSAKKSDQAAAVNLAQSEQQLILKVASAYFDVLRTMDNLASFTAEEEASLSILEQTQEQFDVGLVPITDVYDSQANNDLARVNRLVAENSLQQQLEALEAITGQPHNDLDTLSEEFPVEGAEPTEMQNWVALARENNLSIKAAEFNFHASEDQARSARAAMYPTVDISAGYNRSVTGATASFFPPGVGNVNSGIALNLTIPLYAGGLNSARKRQAYYSRDASQEALLRTERDVTFQTRNNFRSVTTDALEVQARAQAIVSAESALEATEVGLEVGTRNVVDVVLSQRTLFQAQRDYANARYNYIINTLNLKQAAGTLNPQDIYDLNQWLEQ